MPQLTPQSTLHGWRSACLLLAVALAALPALGEKGDRGKPLTIDADKPGSVDLQKQIIVFNGNVVIRQGTMEIRAEHIEVKEVAGGYRSALATGTADKAAQFRQKREGLDETIEGTAERIEYDGRGDVVRFFGHALVRRLRGSTVADEITGRVITYDNMAEVFAVQGGNTSDGSGRVRAILTPRPAASAPAGGDKR